MKFVAFAVNDQDIETSCIGADGQMIKEVTDTYFPVYIIGNEKQELLTVETLQYQVERWKESLEAEERPLIVGTHLEATEAFLLWLEALPLGYVVPDAQMGTLLTLPIYDVQEFY